MIYKTLTILGLILIIASSQSQAQFDPYTSLNMFNQMFYNPGYAGDGNEIEAKALNRSQWMGFEGAPNTFIASVDAPFKLLGHSHGAGLSIMSDRLGNFENTSLNLSYAYRRNLIQGSLGLGIGVNLISHSFTSEWISAGGDASNDMYIPTQSSYKPMVVDLNLGLYYSADNMFFSVSGRNLLSADIKYASPTEASSLKPTLFLGTAYEYQLANPLFSVEPGAFLGTDMSTTVLSISSLLNYNKQFFGGLAFKTGNGYKPSDFTFIAGIDLISGIEVAVSYDIITSKIINYSSGSFEFMVGYSFNLNVDKDTRKYKSVRFL